MISAPAARAVPAPGLLVADLPAAPHPFPCQGSKRNLARRILSFFPEGVGRLGEPFCGSGAVSLAAAAARRASPFWLNDRNAPLMDLWDAILTRPEGLAGEYRALRERQEPDPRAFFLRIRSEFNRSHRPDHLLFLLARIVKGSVRYSLAGDFDQSPDHRRSGMRPETMRRNLIAVSALLSGHTRTTARDYREVLEEVDERDLIYLDPPYQGASPGGDRRYCDGVGYRPFAEALEVMNRRNLSFIVSYDGRTGNKAHGELLPAHLRLEHLSIHAGRSSQATLLGRRLETVESLYLSPVLTDRLRSLPFPSPERASSRQGLLFS